jgi:predicted ATPase
MLDTATRTEILLALTGPADTSAPPLAGGVRVRLPRGETGWRFAAVRDALTAALNLAGSDAPPALAIHCGVLPPGSAPAASAGPAPADDPIGARLLGLLAAAHPGQILLSRAAAQEARRALPAGTTLRDLGDARLCDLLGSERLFQLDRLARPASFPPPLTLDSLPNNLSPQLHPLVGRDTDVAVISGLFADAATRIVTLRGPAGAGKTRLAIQVAATLLPQFPGGVWEISLAAVQDPALIPAAIAKVVGVSEAGGPAFLPRLAAALRIAPMLLLLDNLEGLPGGAAPIGDLLAAAPTVRVLTTSREALYLPGERWHDVAPLALPPDLATLRPAELAAVPAVALFVACAQEVQPGFALTAANAPAVAGICTLLDGLPLALELAAARVAQWSPATLLARLRGEDGHAALPVLAGGAPHLPARQQTLRGAIGWSYSLLSPPEAALFTALAVFAGGCTRGAVAAVINDGVSDLDSLVEKNLLRWEAPQGRYQMLHTIREYAAEGLAERPDAATLRARHAAHYCDLAEQAAATWTTAEQGEWMARLQGEYDNVRAALRWAQQQGDSVLGLRLVAALAPFWAQNGPLDEGRQWIERFLAAGDAPVALRLAARGGLGRLLWVLGDLEAAEAFYHETLALARQHDHRVVTGLTLNQLGSVAYVRGNYEQAGAFYHESLAVRRAVGIPAAVAATLNNVGIVELALGDFAGAEATLHESLALAREIGDEAAAGLAAVNLADLYLQIGEWDRAQAQMEASLTACRQAGDRPGVAGALADLADLARLRGDYTGAQRLGLESLHLWRELGEPISMNAVLMVLARTALAQDEAALACRLFAAALRRFEEQDRRPDMADCLYGLALARGRMGERARAARLAGAARAIYAAIHLPRVDARRAADLDALDTLRAAGDLTEWQTAEAAGAALPLAEMLAEAVQEV